MVILLLELLESLALHLISIDCLMDKDCNLMTVFAALNLCFTDFLIFLIFFDFDFVKK